MRAGCAQCGHFLWYQSTSAFWGRWELAGARTATFCIGTRDGEPMFCCKMKQTKSDAIVFICEKRGKTEVQAEISWAPLEHPCNPYHIDFETRPLGRLYCKMRDHEIVLHPTRQVRYTILCVLSQMNDGQIDSSGLASSHRALRANQPAYYCCNGHACGLGATAHVVPAGMIRQIKVQEHAHSIPLS